MAKFTFCLSVWYYHRTGLADFCDKKSGGCKFYENVLWSEIVSNRKLTFDEGGFVLLKLFVLGCFSSMASFPIGFCLMLAMQAFLNFCFLNFCSFRIFALLVTRQLGLKS